MLVCSDGAGNCVERKYQDLLFPSLFNSKVKKRKKKKKIK